MRNTLQLLLYIQDFESVFAKEDFDMLSNHCCWDHAIKLMSGTEPKPFKVYLLLPVEHSKHNIFLAKNLHIDLFKSLIAMLVFFIKKKDGPL